MALKHQTLLVSCMIQNNRVWATETGEDLGPARWTHRLAAMFTPVFNATFRLERVEFYAPIAASGLIQAPGPWGAS
jgi:hypothetical protein